MLMLLPASEIKGLSLSLKKRTTITFIFALGSLYVVYDSTPGLSVITRRCSACIASIVRLKFAFEYGYSLDLTCELTSLIHSSDPLLQNLSV